jgi:hypothetical protein
MRLQIGERARVTRGQLAAEDEMPCARQTDRMRERLSGQMRVHERGDHAALQQAEPCHDVIGPIFHQQRDHIAFLQAELQSPARVTIRTRVQRGPRHDALVLQNGGTLGRSRAQRSVQSATVIFASGRTPRVSSSVRATAAM